MYTAFAPSRVISAGVVTLLLLLFANHGGQAAVGDALPYSRGYLVTGNYVVGTVDFTSVNNPADSNGLATGIIPINDPATAGGVHLVGAYLYWEAVHPYPITVPTDPTAGVAFRGHNIAQGSIRGTTRPLSTAGATCWGSAGQGSFGVSMFRANVLPLMPKQYDLNGNWTGKYIVNSAELPTAPHTVTLPEKTGDSAIQSAGATLFLVYRLTTPTEPLRKIVVYDGLYTAYDVATSSSTAEMQTMTQSIRGFYKSAGTTARITHLVGTGGNNQTERITVESAGSTVVIGPPPVTADPFPQSSPGSDRSWTAATYNLNAFMPGKPGSNNPNDRYGERVDTSVQATNSSPAACRAWGAVFFSTQVADVDNDGIPDGVEDATNGLRDPDNAELPNLNAMGARSLNQNNTPHPDLFVEVNAMQAAGDDLTTPQVEGTTYGSTAAPYPNPPGCIGTYDPVNKSCTDTVGHIHLPTPEDIKRIGDRYAAHNITLHVDVGNVATYHARGQVVHSDWIDDYASTEADQYLVGANNSTLARGGEIIEETACSAADPECLFPAYPGTVGWKIGLLALRNAPVGDNGEELNPDLTGPNNFNWLDSTQHRLRFDRVRRQFFHYVLGAHTRGTPSSPLPCLVNSVPAPYPEDSEVCATPNPQFHVPSGSGGLADLPGRNVLTSMGLWDEFVGRPYSRQVTMFHELGHNLNLWHSGTPAQFGNATTATQVDANCKPNYLSSMSYLYQLFGLFDEFGQIQLDYSHEPLDTIHENALSDGDFLTTPHYRRAWYTPFLNNPLVASLGILQPASRFCSGAPFGPGQPTTPMARVVSESGSFDPATQTWEIDWDGDGLPDNAAQDANFDGIENQTLVGYNDWANIRLNQISANGIIGGSDDFVFMVGSDELASLIGSDDFVSLIGGDEFVNLIGGDELASLIGGDELVVMIGGDDLAMLIGGDDFVSLIGADDLAMLIGSDDFVSLIGGDDLAMLIGGDDLAMLIGSDQPELTYNNAKGLGRSAPYELTACIAGTQGCFISAQAFTPEFHRNALRWEPSIVGHVAFYQVQRKRTDAPNSAFQDVGTSTSNFFIDDEELPPLSFTYRVQAHFDDPTPPEPAAPTSPWSDTVTITAVNFAPGLNASGTPVSINDSYIAFLNTVLTVPSAGPPATVGLLANDADVDSPMAFIGRRAVPAIVNPPVSGPYTITTVKGGIVVLQNSGAFTYTPPNAYVGPDSFTYKSDDGFWPGDASVPLSAFSNTVTVSITVKKKNQ